MREISTKSIEPFYAPHSKIPVTKDELQRRRRMYENSKKIGVDPTLVTDEEHENPYRAQALLLVAQDKEVPEELIKKIKNYDREYQSKHHVRQD